MFMHSAIRVIRSPISKHESVNAFLKRALHIHNIDRSLYCIHQIKNNINKSVVMQWAALSHKSDMDTY